MKMLNTTTSPACAARRSTLCCSCSLVPSSSSSRVQSNLAASSSAPAASLAPQCGSISGSGRSTAGSRLSMSSALTAPASTSSSSLPDDFEVSTYAAAIINYAIELARASETYQVHSWMILLGILKYEKCTAAQVLQKLGVEDLYGAWHEVLWALHVSDGLQPRPFVPEIGFADRAYRVLTGASNFAAWGGRKKVQSEDLLLALAAGQVLDGLFPDLKLRFGRVRRAVEQQAGGKYVLPDDDEDASKNYGDDDVDVFS